MNDQMILNELVDLLESGGVSVRREALGGGGGGLCKVKGKWIFFLDTEASLQESIACGSEAVARVIEIENIYLRPEVREIINRFRDD